MSAPCRILVPITNSRFADHLCVSCLRVYYVFQDLLQFISSWAMTPSLRVYYGFEMTS